MRYRIVGSVLICASVNLPMLAVGLPSILASAFEPESPRWLLKKGREEEAQIVLGHLHGGGNVNAPFVRRELEEVKATISEEYKHADASWFELFTSNMINRTLVGVFTQVWSQLTGMNMMVSSPSTCCQRCACLPDCERLTDSQRCTTSHTSLRWQGFQNLKQRCLDSKQLQLHHQRRHDGPRPHLG